MHTKNRARNGWLCISLTRLQNLASECNARHFQKESQDSSIQLHCDISTVVWTPALGKNKTVFIPNVNLPKKSRKAPLGPSSASQEEMVTPPQTPLRFYTRDWWKHSIPGWARSQRAQTVFGQRNQKLNRPCRIQFPMEAKLDVSTVFVPILPLSIASHARNFILEINRIYQNSHQSLQQRLIVQGMAIDIHRTRCNRRSCLSYCFKKHNAGHSKTISLRHYQCSNTSCKI